MPESALNERHLPTAESKALEWKAYLAAGIAGLFLFLSVSGVLIYFAPFTVLNQFMVLFHTGLGLLFVLPYVVYQLRHYLYSRRFNLTNVKLLGYCSFFSLATCVVSGLVVTWQPVFSTRLSYAWDAVHTVSGLVAIPIVIFHIVILVLKYSSKASEAVSAVLVPAAKRFAARASFFAVIPTAAVLLTAYAYVPVKFHNEFPQDYNLKYGAGPFRPSLAETSTGGAFDPRSMAESASCGKADCHKAIYDEWLPTAHRYASMDVAFQAVQTAMAKSNGYESTRYCGGCHDPIALFSGSKNVYNEDLSSYGADEGVSCIVCHSIATTDVKGNAAYVIAQPKRYIYELKTGAVASFLSDFLIRAYPRHHVGSYTRSLYKTPEFCGACHKQFIDQEINKVGWVQLQNQYDNWKNSRWNHPGDPTKTITCRECHMPLYASTDPAAGDKMDYNRHGGDGAHRGHRFVGANQFMPAALKLPGGEKQVELTEQWLRGDIQIPEIANKWMPGPVVPIEILAPEQVKTGEQITIKVSMLNNKAGHDFPTGPLDVIQAWVDLTVQDQFGDTLFRSGAIDDRHFIQEGSFILKAEGIDQYGNLIDRHNLWEMVGARFKRALFPGFADAAEYRFLCPAVLRPPQDTVTPSFDFQFEVPRQYAGGLQVTAGLKYRKINQYLINFLFGEQSGLTAPITEISSATKTLWVVKSAGDLTYIRDTVAQ